MKFIPDVLLSILMATALIAAKRLAGTRALWTCAVILSVLFIASLYARWSALALKEGPLIGVVLGGSVPVLAAAALVQRSRHSSLSMVVGLVSVAFLLTYFGALLIGVYILGDIIPLSWG